METSEFVPLDAAVRLEDPDFYLDDPFPVYRRLRDEAPMHWYDPVGFWVASKHTDVREISKSADLDRDHNDRDDHASERRSLLSPSVRQGQRRCGRPRRSAHGRPRGSAHWWPGAAVAIACRDGGVRV